LIQLDPVERVAVGRDAHWFELESKPFLAASNGAVVTGVIQKVSR
jgi:hypothetical protein